MFDKYAMMPMLACIFAVIIQPLSVLDAVGDFRTAEPGLINRLFWPVMTGVTLILALQNYSRLRKLTIPPHMICLLVYAAFAGASITWAFKPHTSFIRYLQQIMILTSIILPTMLAPRTTDVLRAVFLCFAVAGLLNVYFIFSDRPLGIDDGFQGYFAGKNYLGEFATVLFMLSLHEIVYPGFRRVSGVIVSVIAIALLLLCKSKTAFGLLIICPLLAGVMLIIRKNTRISLAVILLTIPLCYIVASTISSFNMSRISFMLYGDSSFTGRTIIWDFAAHEITRRPLFGWGYMSFWLVGLDAPSVVEAPGFVKEMPNGHNGYYDQTLELGYVGYCILLAFIYATVHAVGRVADVDGRRAWPMLSIALYIMTYNFLESFWMRSFEFMWLIFVVLAAEISRYWQLFPSTAASYRSSLPTQTRPLLRGGRKLRRHFR